MKLKNILLLLLVLPSFLLANANLYVFVFKEGVALKNTQIKLGDSIVTTNQYGYAQFNNIKSDTYEISYLKDSIPFALEEVNIVDDQDSQIFLNLVNDKPNVELDLPLEAYSQDFQKVKVKKLEGPKGTLELKLLDSKSKELVKKAKLFFKGYQIEASSDEKGIAKVDIPEGVYDISIVHPNYVMKILKEVKVTKDKTTTQDVALTKSDIALEEYVVLAPAVEGSLASTFAELKDSDVAGDALSAEQFSKSGDSSAAAALKRVTGITIVGGKYVFVRGLGERYSTVLLNGLHVPSPEPTKRVVPLDIFPTSIIQSMNIQKTWTSDLPGTFGGGTIDITTKDIPKEDNYVQGSLGLSYNNSVGESGLYSADNSKAIPSLLLDMSENFTSFEPEIALPDGTVLVEGYSQEELDKAIKTFTQYRSLNLEKKTIEPGKSASVSFGQAFKTSGGLKYGFAGNLYYKTQEELESYYKGEVVNYLGDDVYKNEDEVSSVYLNEKYGGLLSLSLDDQTSNKIKLTTIYLEETKDESVYDQKRSYDVGTGAVDQANSYDRTYYIYKEQNLQLHQLEGNHNIKFGKSNDKLFDDIDIDWKVSSGKATSTEPGSFEYKYRQSAGESQLYKNGIYATYNNLEDTVANNRLDLTLPFEFNERDNYTKLGYFTYSKEREYDSRWFSIKLNNSVASPIDDVLSDTNNISQIATPYKDADTYKASQEVDAIYIKQLISVTNQIDILLGLREESSTQKLTTGDVNTKKVDKEFEPLETKDNLPSLALTYRYDDDIQIRSSYTKTLTRPDFREFSPNRYKNRDGEIVKGYEGLKYTTIDNYDLKVEWYPSFDEVVSFAVFKKDFINPIETVRTVNDVDVEVSFRNAKSAESLGYEVSFRKKLTFLNEKLENFFISGNYAIIESTISLDKNNTEYKDDQYIPYLTTDSRPMQGQSPYVANMQLGYDNVFTGRSAIFSYNEYGKRITALGINGNPDIYEEPFKKLDFVLKYQINDTYDINEKKVGYSVSFKAQNLLDSEQVSTQGGTVAKKVKPGRAYSLNLSIKY